MYPTGIISGVVLFTCMYLNVLLYCLFCRVFRIRITQFSVFSAAGFKLHSAIVSGIQYTLGWIPFIVFIKPLGFEANESEKKVIPESDHPYAFFNKPRWVKLAFKLVPLFFYFCYILVPVVFLKHAGSYLSELFALKEYLVIAFKDMFNPTFDRDIFIKSTQEILNNNSPVLFCIVLITWSFFPMVLFQELMKIVVKSGNPKNPLEYVELIFTIPMLWVYFWKVPKFLYIFFNFGDMISGFCSFYAGDFFTGIVAYFVTFFVVKLSAAK